MAKRKRPSAAESGSNTKLLQQQEHKKARVDGPRRKSHQAASATDSAPRCAKSKRPVSIQIIAGSYDRVLHGVTASIDGPPASPPATFADTFLFNAHRSAIRCLAVSAPSAAAPGESQTVILATGSTDERVNVYRLSAHPPPTRASAAQALLSAVARRPILEHSGNRELGTLLHHSSSLTRLVFPTRSKLLSAAEDSTIAVTRTRDWSLLSTIKAPVPRALGRPSGDTAPMGGTPSGVNDFAVHPSMKVMISVSKGERCMRLWNLVTGKKAGVLEFGRDVLQAIGEGRHASTAEGRKVVWGTNDDGSGDEFAVGFSRDVLVYGMDSEVRCSVMPDASTKIHHICYVSLPEKEAGASVLGLSTEDGRILFFSTRIHDLEQKQRLDGKTASLPRAKLLAQVGGRHAGVAGRVKDFKVLQADDAPGIFYIVSASSDGHLRLWEMRHEDLRPDKAKEAKAAKESLQVGNLLGSYETKNRITCVEAFVMIPRPEGVEESEDGLEDDEDDDLLEEEGEEEEEEEEENSDDDDDDDDEERNTESRQT